MLRNNFRIFGRMILTVKGERADAVSSPAAPLRKGNVMFCPHCGSQQPDGAVFCGNCGQSMVGAPSAPQAAPARQAPAQQQPVAAPAPASAAHHGFGSSGSNFQGTLSAATGFGKRSLAMLGGAVASFVCMFQPWVSLPFADKGLDYALQQSASGSSTAMIEQQLGGAFKAFINTSFDMPHVFSLSGSLRGIASAANTYITQMSSYADLPALQQAQSAVGSINLAANVLTIFFVLWVACLAALIAGVVLKFVKKNDVVLIAAFGATAAISLICVIASFVVNGQIESNLVSAFTSMGSSSTAGIIASIKPFIQPAFGAILTLIFSAAGLVCSFVLKED